MGPTELARESTPSVTEHSGKIQVTKIKGPKPSIDPDQRCLSKPLPTNKGDFRILGYTQSNSIKYSDSPQIRKDTTIFLTTTVEQGYHFLLSTLKLC